MKAFGCTKSVALALWLMPACGPIADGPSGRDDDNEGDAGDTGGDAANTDDGEVGDGDGSDPGDGTDDGSGDGTESCEVADVNQWVLETMLDRYLWNETIPQVDLASFATPGELVAALRYELDRWSRISDKTTSDSLFMEGKIISYGWRTKWDADGGLRLASVYPSSPADQAGLRRGDRFVSLNGMTVEDIDAAGTWNDVWGPAEPGVELSGVFETPSGETIEVDIIKDWMTIVTVSTSEVLARGDRTIGYLVLETFVDPAHDALKQAFSDFGAAGVDTLVVDLRYNGGGLLAVTQTFANLIGGSTAEGSVMYEVEYNENHSADDKAYQFAALAESIAVEDVVFITTGRTLSASELLINALRPYVNVAVVGGSTGGKPFGSHRFERCEKILFPLTFRLVNAAGFTDYFSGLVPDCPADDELVRQLGDPVEASFAEALTWLETGSCSPAEAQRRGGTQEREAPLVRQDGLDQVLGGAW